MIIIVLVTYLIFPLWTDSCGSNMKESKPFLRGQGGNWNKSPLRSRGGRCLQCNCTPLSFNKFKRQGLQKIFITVTTLSREEECALIGCVPWPWICWSNLVCLGSRRQREQGITALAKNWQCNTTSFHCLVPNDVCIPCVMTRLALPYPRTE